MGQASLLNRKPPEQLRLKIRVYLQKAGRIVSVGYATKSNKFLAFIWCAAHLNVGNLNT